MNAPLRILLLEDQPAEAALTLSTLKKNGIEHQVRTVDTRAGFLEALEREEFDIILSDFAMPSFDGLSALRLFNERTAERRRRNLTLHEVPFIFVSGTIGEEVAIESLQNGATDYVLKQRLSRLAPAVRRALAEAGERTARFQAERAQRELEVLFRTLFEQVAVGVLIVGPDGTILRANPALEKMLGYAAGKLASRRWADMAFPQDAAAMVKLQTELTAGQRPSYEIEQFAVRKDGSGLSVRSVVSLARGEAADDQAGVFFIHLVEDVTERNEMQRRLLQAEKMEAVGRLAAGCAHDFNNLLTIISGYSELLLKKSPEFSSERKQLQQIARAGEKAATLTRRLLTLSRQEVAHPTVLDLNQLLSKLEPDLTQSVGNGIRLVLDLSVYPPMVRADEGEIDQTLMNLVNNARDAMPNGGEIRVALRIESRSDRLGEDVVLTVADTGEGMDDATRSRIFEPFFTTKPVGKGTGLGLWMISEIVKRNGGTIKAESCLGRGTTFRIQLPRVDKDAASAELVADAAS